MTPPSAIRQSGMEVAVPLCMTSLAASPAVIAAALSTLLGGAGCVHRDNPHADVDAELDRYGRQLYGSRVDRAAARWSVSCPSSDAVASSVGRERRCGLAYDEVTRPLVMEEFIRDVCAEEVTHLGEASDDCRRLFREMVFAKWAERYDYLAPEAIERHCFAEPTVCRRPRELELWLVMAHNDAVDRAYDDAVGQAHAEHVDRLADASRSDAEANAAYAQQNPRTFNRVMSIYRHFTADWRCSNIEIAEGWEETYCVDRRD